MWLAAAVALCLRVFFVGRFPASAGDSAIYEELARNWLDHHVYGLFIDGHLTPVDIRAPGYPAFLAAVYVLATRTRLAVMLAQAALDVVTCFLAVGLATRLAPPESRRRVAIAALCLAAACPFVANYSAVVLTEVLATFLTTLALLVFVLAAENQSASAAAPSFAVGSWFVGSVIVGLGALVRPETPLILAALAPVLVVRWRRPGDWLKLARVSALAAVGLALPLLPWGARNWRVLHQAEFLAPRHAELPGEFVPHGFHAWGKTWLVRFRDVYQVAWKLEDQPIHVEDAPASAFDSAEERARVAALLERYNESLTMSPEIDAGFAQIARERTARHPLRTYLWVPLGRMATMWFTPRTELLPVSGHLWPLGEQWSDDPTDVSVTVFLGLLNFFYVGLGLAGLWFALRRREKTPAQHFGLALLAMFILLRTAFLTQIETPEPRYVIPCFPALLALAALLWARARASDVGAASGAPADS